MGMGLYCVDSEVRRDIYDQEKQKQWKYIFAHVNSKVFKSLANSQTHKLQKRPLQDLLYNVFRSRLIIYYCFSL